MSRLLTLARKAYRRVFPRPAPPIIVCGCPADKNGLPFGQVFRNILIMPGQTNPDEVNLIDGGPVWPDFDKQTWVRLRRKNRPVDRMVEPVQPPTARLDVPCVWGGPIHFHFGHLCAEFLTRLPWSLARWPRATYLFIIKETETPDDVPDYFWQLLRHFGLPKEQVQLIRQPTLVSELHVMPQAEQVRLKGNTPESYLRLLQPKTDHILKMAQSAPVLYVSREGMIERRCGSHAGESYLLQVLSQLNVSVIDPGAASLQEQLSRYAGAQNLVFAEGSAIHGRQLLGHIDQNCIVLNRRPANWRTGGMVARRVRKLEFFEAASSMATFWNPRGYLVAHRGISFYDLPVLFQAFRSVGIDLEPHWDIAAYNQHKRKDAATWVDIMVEDAPNFDMARSFAGILDIFQNEGLSDLLAGHSHLAVAPSPAHERAAS